MLKTARKGIIIKTPEEITGIRNSGHLACKALQYITPFVKDGVDTLYLDTLIEEFVTQNNAIPATKGYRGYKHASCISINEAVCHGVPKKEVIVKNGDIVKVDITTILNGYFGDTCITIPVGDCKPEALHLMNTAKKCLDEAIKQCKPGAYLDIIGYTITQLAQSEGYSVVFEYCGHGVGVKFHEDPEVNHARFKKPSGLKLQPGMTFTIEPMINQGKARTMVDKQDKWTVYTIDGKLSAQFEHTILITETGCEVLTDADNVYPIT